MSIKSILTDANDLLFQAGINFTLPFSSTPLAGIDKIRSEINKRGIQQNSRFTVDFFAPSELPDTRLLSLRCFASTFPGKQLMLKDDVVRYGYGMIDKLPHNVLYTDVSCSFILDNKGVVLSFFHQWMDMINDASVTADFTNGAYQVAYKEDYAGSVHINQWNQQNNKILTCKLHEAFPIAIGDVQMAWDSNSSLAVLPVTFTYVNYDIHRQRTLPFQ